MLRKRPKFALLTSADSSFPGRSHGLFPAFSSERLMGFTLVSDTCWKCNCAHNCYLGMEAASPPLCWYLPQEKTQCTREAFPVFLLMELRGGSSPGCGAPGLGGGGKARRNYLGKHSGFQNQLSGAPFREATWPYHDTKRRRPKTSAEFPLQTF